MKTLISCVPFLAMLLCSLLLPAVASADGSSGDNGTGLLMLLGIYLLAIVLMMVEVFIIPGFGIAGFVAIIAMGFCGYQAFALYGMGTGAIVTLVLFGLAGVLVLVALKIFARTSAGRDFVLSSSVDGSAKKETPGYDADLWIGRILKTTTDLRPSGRATVDDQTVEVYCEGSFVKTGSSVKVFRIDDNRLYVREVEES